MVTLLNKLEASDRRTRRKAETQERIIRVALALFARKGFNETTVEEITDGADVAKGTFFNYFPNKESVLQRALKMQAQVLREMGERAPHAPDLRAFHFEFVLRRMHRQSRTHLLMRNVLGVALTNPELTKTIQHVVQTGRRAMTNLLSEGQRRGVVRTDYAAVDLAREFQQCVFGTQMIWSLDASSELASRLKQMLEIFWHGIAPESKGAAGTFSPAKTRTRPTKSARRR